MEFKFDLGDIAALDFLSWRSERGGWTGLKGLRWGKCTPAMITL